MTVRKETDAVMRPDSNKRTHVVGTLVTASVLGLLVVLAMRKAQDNGGYEWDFSVIPDNLDLLLEGVRLTLILTAVCMASGLVLGVFVAAARMSSIRLLRVATSVYIDVMRATPLLIQLVWIFYALPILLGVRLDGNTSAFIALTLHMGAYYGEAFRAGIQAVPRTQVEAAEILGLTRIQRMRYVVMPQATRNVLPVLVTLGVLLVKDTSLVSVIGMTDLMHAGTNVALTTYRPLEVFTVVGLIYLAIVMPMTFLVNKFETRLSRHLATRPTF